MPDNTGGGTTTSFSNTPQAKADTYDYNWLTEEWAGIYCFDVMSNDLGGAAKTLWAVDNGTNSTTSTLAGADLLIQDTARIESCSTDTSLNGAKIWITSDGKVGYDAGTLSASFKASLQALAVGETANDTFTYAIRLGNGTLSWNTVTVVYKGANDGPDISLVTGDSAAKSMAETNAALTTCGTLTVVDPDTSDKVTMGVTGFAKCGDAGALTDDQLKGMFGLSSTLLEANAGSTHNLGWSFDSHGATFDYLAAGQCLTLTYTVTANDAHGGVDTQQVTVTINGSNDLASITVDGSVTDDRAASESGGYNNLTTGDPSASGKLLVSDVDSGENHFGTPASLEGSYGTFTFNTTTGEWTYTLNEAKADGLSAGAHVTDTLIVSSADGTDSHSIIVNITGTNDEPVLDHSVADHHSSEDGAVSYQIPADAFSDVDGDDLSYTVTLANDDPLPGWLSFDATTRTLSGTPPYDFNGTLSLKVTASDGSLTATDTFDLVIDAVNDAPVVSGTATLAAILEDAANPSGATVASLFGANFSDAKDAVPGGSSANALAGIAISNYTADPAKGAWQYSSDGGTSWTAVPNSTASSALTLESDDLLRFVPAANYNGQATGLSANLIESGQVITSGAAIDLTGATGGSSHISSAAVALSETIVSVNDAPYGADNTVTIAEDGSQTFSVSDFGFTDAADGNALSAVIITTLPAAGSLTLGGNPVGVGDSVPTASLGQLVFTPAANANGTGYANFTFQVRDDGGTTNGGGDTDPTANTITVNVTEVNDAPVAGDDALTSVPEDSPMRIISFASLLGNDSAGPNEVGQTLTIISLDNIVGGSAIINGTNIEFTPTPNFNGLASFDYTVRDNGTTNGVNDFRTDVGHASFTVTEVNDAPIAAGDTLTSVLEDSGTRIITFADLLGNDSTGPANESGQTLDIISVGSAVGGSVAIVGGHIEFTPTANFNGAASFSYTVRDNGTTNGLSDPLTSTATASFTIVSVNDAPSGADNIVAILEDGSHTFSASDFGFSDVADGNALSAVIITTLPAAGSLTLNDVVVVAGQSIAAGDIGGLVFTPAANANGDGYASFTFTVQDDGGTANGGVDKDPTPNSITFDVTSVNDAPSGADKTVSTAEDTAYHFSIADFGFTDSVDGNALLAVGISTLPSNGTLTLNGGVVSAGQYVSATAIAAGDLVFTPAANANGTGYASFTFEVQDDGGAANGGVDLDASSNTITVNVTEVNDAPTAVDDLLTGVAEDSAVRIISFASLLGNDSAGPNEAGQSLTITSLSNVVGGTAIINGTNIEFTPAANFNGTASFDYTVRDNGTTNGVNDFRDDVGSASFTITEVNDAPAATTDALSNVLEDSGTRIISFAELLGNDSNGPSNESGQTLDIISVGSAVGGTVAIVGGHIEFTPTANFNGGASFSYTVQDNGTTNGLADPLTSTATASFTSVSVNDAPSGADKTVTILEDRSHTFSASDFGFSDAADGNALLAVTITTVPVSGTLILNGSAVTAGQSIAAGDLGGLVFTPVANANGAGYASFTFRVQDNGGTANGGIDVDQSANTITFDVTGVNDAPSGADKTVSTAEDTAYHFSAADFGFTDADGNSLLAVKITTLPSNGTLTLNGGAVSAGQSVSATAIAAGGLVFTPAANANGISYSSFTFQVQDHGGRANGGIDTDQTANTITIDVSAVNDAAVITGDDAKSITEDATPNTVSGDLNSTDVDGVNDSWQPQTIASTNGYGSLQINANGTWTYTLDNGNATVNALNTGDPALTDLFTVQTADGTQRSVTITIIGHTDFAYSAPPLSNAPDSNDFDDLHSGSVRSTILVMSPGSGGSGPDVYEGSNSQDTIYGGTGADEIYGHDGGDRIYGENGADMLLYGQRGDDFMYGGNGSDRIYGGSGNDTIYGNTDPDVGGDTADTIYGGSGRDTIYGQGGNDVIIGGNGQDLLTGGDGADRYVYTNATDTGDFIFDFVKGADTIDLTALNMHASSFAGQLSGAGLVGAGQFGYLSYNNGTTIVTTIYVDTNGSYGADLEITLIGGYTLDASNFNLLP